MNIPVNRKSGRTASTHKAMAFLIGIVAAFSSSSTLSAVEIAQRPLYLGSDVPGNLMLVPSVEFPTIHSQANIGSYDPVRRYSGYFDPDKCYAYHYDDDELERHFYPVRKAKSFTCPDEAKDWSGNYLNWAATQTIDPFRSALTGGYRVKDTPTETWLEKARHYETYGLFPDRRLPASGNNIALVQDLTPANWENLNVRIQGLRNKMRFTASGNMADGNAATPYNPANPSHRLVHGWFSGGWWDALLGDANRVYEVSMRVKVCDASVGVEANCKPYAQGWKPEGLIQEYSDRIRYSIFGFLNDNSSARNGGVLRARQKFVGPDTHYPEQGALANVHREWDPVTGVLVRNPNPADAAATGLGVEDSGVINYLNKFGQMTWKDPKSYDPVSELYYAALRYFRGQGNLAEYTNNLDWVKTDGFPVITDWDDPIKYACQVNAALGIGDVYTHVDHDLPTTPVDDLALARTYTQKIFDLEGIKKNSNEVFSGRGNSAYIAGLAYYANTNDLRPDNKAQPNSIGRQTLSTYWVDVRENQNLEPKTSNQYWLAAKYGGLRVPQGFDPLGAGSVDESWWHTTNEYLVSGGNGGVTTTVTGYPRPDNFYVASEADKMVASLRRAFEAIVAEMKGAGGSFASNTTRLETGAMTFQAQFFSGNWGGELEGYDINPSTGAMTLAWTASSKFPDWGDRKIVYGSGADLLDFEYGNLAGTPMAAASEDIVNYARGDRTKEGAGGLRARRGVLGDIVNSQPVYVGTPNGQLYKGKTFAGASTYPAFVAANTPDKRTPVVYVGANDGMLHAFEAATGKELFAFVPQTAMSVLADPDGFSSPDYQHVYTVDGDLTVADVYIGGAWKTVLVGSMGRGGRSMFALDVTDPSSPKLLWEIDQTDVPALGNVLSQPIIGQIASGKWRVFVGNGPNSDDGRARLIMLDVANGSAAVSYAGSATDNGLSGVNAWASTSSGFVDRVYAGDFKGNMWKFTGIAGTPTGSLLFAAGTTKPITATPLVARNPATLDTWVFFGTGSYMNEDDLANKSVQTWYGLIDKGPLPINASNLRKTDILAEGVVSDRAVRTIESYANPGVNGWYMNLVSPKNGNEGERMVEPNFFRGLALIGTTRIPESSDVCSPSGKGFTMAISPFTGGRLQQTYFDINKDGSFDSKDTLGGVPVSGIGYESSPNNPIFLGDIIYTSLDDGGSDVIKTNASASNIRRVSWREHTRID